MTNRLNIEYEMNDSSISTILVFSDFRNLLICSVTGMNMNVMNLETNSLNGKKWEKRTIITLFSQWKFNRKAVFPMVNNRSRLFFHRGNYISDPFFGAFRGSMLGKRVRCLTKSLPCLCSWEDHFRCFTSYMYKNVTIS